LLSIDGYIGLLIGNGKEFIGHSLATASSLVLGVVGASRILKVFWLIKLIPFDLHRHQK